MVLCSIHLIALKEGTTPPTLLSSLHQAGINPIVQARVFRWMILPKELSAGHLLARNIRWDMLLVLSTDEPSIAPSLRQSSIAAEWTATVGTSARLLAGYAALNAQLLHPAPGTVPPATLDLAAAAQSDSSQKNLELTPELADFVATLPARLRSHPVSMLNLIAFNPGKQPEYVKYGQEFSARVGARYGGRVKIVGKVTSSGAGGGGGRGEHDSAAAAEKTRQEKRQEAGWDEIAFVHYPSIAHFASMAGDKDYQDVNQKYRLGALRDTFIICALEITDDGEVVGGAKNENKVKL
ncbi:hypothetical protein F4678DRAFT_432492 [Xylaria arbuscula]|nr:hypothetical protein F4678DRAFT_432492 [Xylaria arbuscula]